MTRSPTRRRPGPPDRPSTAWPVAHPRPDRAMGSTLRGTAELRPGRGGPSTCSGERGVVGGLEALPFAVLVFVGGSLLLLNAWGVIDARFAVTSAAREATRSYAEAADPATGHQSAHRTAREAMASAGRDPERLRLDGPDGTFARCARVSYTASYPVPAVRLPFVGGLGSGFTVSATHTERIDDLRSGLPGEATCGR